MAESTVFLHVAYLRLAVPSTKTGYLLSVLEAVFAVKQKSVYASVKLGEYLNQYH